METIDPSNIKGRIQQQNDAWEKLGAPHVIEAFVLRFGTVGISSPFVGKRHTPKECFCNAVYIAVERQLHYVEGYACRDDLPLIVHHAWAEDDDGNVVDPTWKNPEICSYMGVHFDLTYVLTRIAKQEYYGLYTGPMIINTKFLEEETTKRLEA